MGYKYLIVGNMIFDRIYHPGREPLPLLFGGGGGHAYTGIKLYTDDVVFVTTVGEDLDELGGEWLRKNGVSYDGFTFVDPHNMYNYVEYYGDKNERTEILLHGRKHRAKFYWNFDMMDKQAPGATGVYLYDSDDSEHWARVMDCKRKNGFTLMWEITSRTCVPERLESVRRICREIECFSINSREGKTMFGVETDDEVIERLKDIGADYVFYRVGADGGYSVKDGRHWYLPSAPVSDELVVDVTGCGNSSVAGALYGYCESDGDPIVAGITGHVASSYALRQYGPIADMVGENRTNAASEVKRLHRLYLDTGTYI